VLYGSQFISNEDRQPSSLLHVLSPIYIYTSLLNVAAGLYNVIVLLAVTYGLSSVQCPLYDRRNIQAMKRSTGLTS